jgi:hypothetical protein
VSRERTSSAAPGRPGTGPEPTSNRPLRSDWPFLSSILAVETSGAPNQRLFQLRVLPFARSSIGRALRAGMESERRRRRTSGLNRVAHRAGFALFPCSVGTLEERDYHRSHGLAEQARAQSVSQPPTPTDRASAGDATTIAQTDRITMKSMAASLLKCQVPFGSKREKLGMSKSGPLCSIKRTSVIDRRQVCCVMVFSGPSRAPEKATKAGSMP